MIQVPVSYDVFGNPIYKDKSDPLLAIADTHKSESPYPTATGPGHSQAPLFEQQNDMNQPVAQTAAQQLLGKSIPPAQQQQPAQQPQAPSVPQQAGAPVDPLTTIAAMEAVKQTPSLFASEAAAAAPEFDLAATGVGDLFGGGGAAAGTGAAEAASVPLATTLAPYGVAGIAAYTGNAAMNAYKNSKGKGIKDGLGQGIKDAGILNFVPVLGQAAWLAGMFGGMGGPNKRERQRTALVDQFNEQGGLAAGVPGVRGSTLTLSDDTSGIDRNPLGGVAVSLVDPIAEALSMGVDPISGGPSGIREDISAVYASSILNGANNEKDLINNALSYLKQQGIKRDDVFQKLGAALAAGKIDADRLAVYSQSLSQLTGMKPEAVQAAIQSYSGAKP